MNRISELQRNNKAAMTAHFITVAVMLALMVIQAVRGDISFGYVAVMGVIGAVPVILEFIFWSRNRETNMVRHLAAVGFAIFYTVCMFTEVNQLVFIFVIPIVFVVAVYNDVKYQMLINIGTVLENLAVVILGAATGKFGYQGVETAVIQMVVICMVAVYSAFTTRTLKANTDQRIGDISQSRQQAEVLLQANAELSDRLSEGITAVHEKMEELSRASKATKAAMEEVSAGAEDTSRHVINQRQQTETIQGKVNEVHDVSVQISTNMRQTMDALDTGNRNVSVLVGQVEASVENGTAVNEKLETLGKYMEKMNTIVELIGGITSQTSMLALNASIEAARAGEAGRGFSVVATQISEMATRTKDATVSINSLIDDVSKAIREVMGVVADMVSGIDEEKQGALHAAESFQAIRDNAQAVCGNMEGLAQAVEELNASNQVIVDSVQTISAISEEVSAHAGETMGAEEKNAVVMEQIIQVMQELMTLARKC